MTAPTAFVYVAGLLFLISQVGIILGKNPTPTLLSAVVLLLFAMVWPQVMK